MHAMSICRSLLAQITRRACSRARVIDGRRIATSNAMIATTTRSSISVKASLSDRQRFM